MCTVESFNIRHCLKRLEFLRSYQLCLVIIRLKVKIPEQVLGGGIDLRNCEDTAGTAGAADTAGTPTYQLS